MGMGGGWGDPVVFVSEVVDKIGKLGSPSHIKLLGGNLYVSDTGAGEVAVFNIYGEMIATVTGCGAPLGVDVEFVEETTCGDPRRVTHDALGNLLPGCATTLVETLYVADEESGSVRIFKNGEPAGYLGGGSGEFLMPNGLAATAERVYVVDSRRNEVRTYDKNGAFTGAFGSYGAGDGQFDFPIDIAVDEGALEIYVTDWRNGRVVVFDLWGNWLRNIRTPLNDRGNRVFFRPSGIGLGPGGKLFVVDNALSSVTVMDRSGILLDVFGYQNGAYWTGEMKVPVDAAYDGLWLYVTSSGEGRINVFEAAP